jgi:trehalose/maltose hydrolase-like predicted phosphorylase
VRTIRHLFAPALAAAAAVALGLALGAAPAPAWAARPGGGPASGDAGWVLSTTDPSTDYAPTFVGNGYLAARVPAAGEGYSAAPVTTESELAGFYAKPAGQFERRAALPTWTTLGFGRASEPYGVPGNWSCAYDQLCPAEYGQISGGAFVETSHPGSIVGGYLAGLNTNNQPTVGGTDVVPIHGAPAGTATLDIRYANASGGPQTVSLVVNGTIRQLTVPTLGSWDDWAVLSVPVTLAAGDNTLEITVAPGDTARVNVDYLAVHAPGSAAPTTVASSAVGTTEAYRQSLDLRTGTVTTSFDWTSPSGERTSFTYAVAANRADGHLGTVRLTAVPHWSGTATVDDEFDGRGMEQASATDPQVHGGNATMSQTVVTAGDLVTAGMTSVLRVGDRAIATTAMPLSGSGSVGQTASFPVVAGRTYSITKYVGVASSVDTDRSGTAATPQQAAAATATDAADAGYANVAGRNDRAWSQLWSSDITIPGDARTTAQIRAAMFYLLASMRAGVTWSTSPGGLSSNGYNGHVFWDMETWMYPALLAQHPEIAVGADTYRQKLLPAAEAAAAALSTPQHPIRGAKFPWESSLTGRESIPPGNPEGADEIHIDSDIALAQWQYYEASGDSAWLRHKGWPVLANIADYWATRAVPDGAGGYDIDHVQGPDEYHDGVDNSVTTDAGAQASLRIATAAAHLLGKAADPLWTTVADGLKIPVDPTTGIHPEYDGYSGQTVKQADVTLLQYPWNVPMPAQVAQNDLDHYAKVTDVGGPSMTDAIASIDSSALDSSGCSSYTYLRRSADAFLAAPFDQFHEARSGGAFTFTTGEGGFLQEFLYGFTGLRWGTGAVALDPSLPPQLPGVDLTGLKWHGRVFDLSVGQSTTTVTLRSGAALPVTVAGRKARDVKAGHTLRVPTRHPDVAPTADRARCAPVAASSADPSYPAVAAVDGSSGTWWKPTAPGATLTVDLGKVTRVGRIDVDAPSSTTAYTLQASRDGRTWTTVATQPATTQTATTHALAAEVEARYVRYGAAADAVPEVAGLVVTTGRPGPAPPRH